MFLSSIFHLVGLKSPYLLYCVSVCVSGVQIFAEGVRSPEWSYRWLWAAWHVLLMAQPPLQLSKVGLFVCLFFHLCFEIGSLNPNWSWIWSPPTPVCWDTWFSLLKPFILNFVWRQGLAKFRLVWNSVDKAGLTLPFSTSWVLGVKSCAAATTPSFKAFTF